MVDKCYDSHVKSQPKTTLLAQLLGAGGYIACVLEWGWLVVLSMPALLRSDLVQQMQHPQALHISKTAQHTLTLGDAVLITAITVLCIGLAVYLLLKLPLTMTKTASRIVHTSSDFVVPKVVYRKHLSKKRLLVLSARAQLIIKMLCVVVPLVIIACVPFPDVPLEPVIIWIVTWFVAGWACVLFSLQWLIASLFKLNYTELW